MKPACCLFLLAFGSASCATVGAADGEQSILPNSAPRITEAGKDSPLVAIPIASGGDGAPKSWASELSWDAGMITAIVGVDGHAERYRHNGFDYSVRRKDAAVRIENCANGVSIRPSGDALSILF